MSARVPHSGAQVSICVADWEPQLVRRTPESPTPHAETPTHPRPHACLPSPGPGGPPRRRPRCSVPYPLLLLPDSGLHPGENLDGLLHHLLPGFALTLDLSQALARKTSDSHHFRRAAALATITRDTTQGAPRQLGPPPLPNWLQAGRGGLKGSLAAKLGWG